MRKISAAKLYNASAEGTAVFRQPGDVQTAFMKTVSSAYGDGSDPQYDMDAMEKIYAGLKGSPLMSEFRKLITDKMTSAWLTYAPKAGIAGYFSPSVDNILKFSSFVKNKPELKDTVSEVCTAVLTRLLRENTAFISVLDRIASGSIVDAARIELSKKEAAEVTALMRSGATPALIEKAERKIAQEPLHIRGGMRRMMDFIKKDLEKAARKTSVAKASAPSRQGPK